MDDEMKVSVIIPTRNGGLYLEQLFVSLKEQSFKPDQILVVDSSSKDDSMIQIFNTILKERMPSS